MSLSRLVHCGETMRFAQISRRICQGSNRRKWRSNLRNCAHNSNTLPIRSGIDICERAILLLAVALWRVV